MVGNALKWLLYPAKGLHSPTPRPALEEGKTVPDEGRRLPEQGGGGQQLDTNWVRPQTHPRESNKLRPRPEVSLLQAQKALLPSRGLAWSTSAPVIPVVRAVLAPESARDFRVPAPSHHPRELPASRSVCFKFQFRPRGCS